MKRPKSVTLLAFGVLILAGYYLLRVVQAALQWDYLIEFFPASFIPYYLVLTGVFWGGSLLLLGWGLLRRRSWAPWYYRILAILFAAFWWLDSLFIAVDPAVRGATIFRLVVTILLLVLTFWILARPGAKSYFGELND